MRFRYEKKYLLSNQAAETLKRRVSAVLSPDSHSGGVYTVHNLYLDDLNDSFYREKSRGSLIRDKYRARFYNGDLSFIRLERKHKEGELSYKESAALTEGQYHDLLAGRLDFTLDSPDPLLSALGTLHRLRGMRPAAAFTYRREAYVYPTGNVRVTFDSGIAEDELPKTAGGARGVLEVKYDHFLPSVISGLLSGVTLAQTEMSKYGYVREKGRLLYVGLPEGTLIQPLASRQP